MMIRRGWIALAVLLSISGCGLIGPGLRMSSNNPPRAAVSRTFDTSVNRVLLAAMDSTGVEFSQEGPDFHFPIESVLSIRGDVKPMGELPPAEVAEVNFGSGHLSGRTKDGRPVTLWIQSADAGKSAEAFILVGRHGDSELCRKYLDWVADWLDQPSGNTEDGTRKGKLLLGQALAGPPKKDPVGAGPGGPNR